MPSPLISATASSASSRCAVTNKIGTPIRLAIAATMTEVLEPALPTIAMGNFADVEVADVDESLKSAVTRSRHFDVRMRSNHCML